MPSITLKLDGANAWPDLQEKMLNGKLIHYAGPAIEIATLKGGMESGRTSVTLRFDLPDGTTLVAETSLALFVNAARAMRARYEDEFDDPNPFESTDSLYVFLKTLNDMELVAMQAEARKVNDQELLQSILIELGTRYKPSAK